MLLPIRSITLPILCHANTISRTFIDTRAALTTYIYYCPFITSQRICFCSFGLPVVPFFLFRIRETMPNSEEAGANANKHGTKNGKPALKNIHLNSMVEMWYFYEYVMGFLVWRSVRPLVSYKCTHLHWTINVHVQNAAYCNITPPLNTFIQQKRKRNIQFSWKSSANGDTDGVDTANAWHPTRSLVLFHLLLAGGPFVC